MANEKQIAKQSAGKHIVNVAKNTPAAEFSKNNSLKPGTAINKLKQQIQKTTEERVIFIEKFADIIKENISVKDHYLISFVDVNFCTRVYITDKEKAKLNLIKLLSKIEYEAYTNLLTSWNI